MRAFPKPSEIEKRVKLTTREKTAQLDRKVREQHNRCFYCEEPMTRSPFHLNTATRDHVTPRGMGGGSLDDSDSNIVAACAKCNGEKGSQRGWTKNCNKRRK